MKGVSTIHDSNDIAEVLQNVGLSWVVQVSVTLNNWIR